MASFSTDPGSPGDKPDGPQPRLWAEGRQRPGFDMRAFLRVSVANSRAVAAPVLLACAGHIHRFGSRVEDGFLRIPANRLGRSGKWLPSHVSTGRRLHDTAALTRIAAEAARGPEPVKPMPFRGWNDAATPAPTPTPPAPEHPHDASPMADRPPVQRPKRPAPLPMPQPNTSADSDRDTLEAIRNLMHTSAVEPARATRSPKAPAAPPPMATGADALPDLAPAEPTPRSALFKLTGQVLGSIAVGLALPVGMVKATIAVARGEDLRQVS